MTRLPLLEAETLCGLLTAGISSTALEQPASVEDVDRAVERVFGSNPALPTTGLELPSRPRLRDVYAAVIESDRFRAACGRISASYEW